MKSENKKGTYPKGHIPYYLFSLQIKYMRKWEALEDKSQIGKNKRANSWNCFLILHIPKFQCSSPEAAST